MSDLPKPQNSFMIYDCPKPYANRPSPTDAAQRLRNLFRNIVRNMKQRGAKEKA